MGGRGASSGFVQRMPNANQAIIADAKITRYLLSPTGKHYAEFIAVGYSENQPEVLRTDLIVGLASNPAKIYAPNSHGDQAIEVDMMLGVTRKARFRTGWQIDAGSDIPRFVTAHRIGRNRK